MGGWSTWRGKLGCMQKGVRRNIKLNQKEWVPVVRQPQVRGNTAPEDPVSNENPLSSDDADTLTDPVVELEIFRQNKMEK